jgi:hypothetical protein
MNRSRKKDKKSMQLPQIRKPRCFMVYAMAPDDLSPSEANRVFNAYVADRRLPLVIFHDHFIGKPGGVAIFYVENAEERQALLGCETLNGWAVEIRPLIFSYSPAAFDAQTSYTMAQYRDEDWETLQRVKRPHYGNPVAEAETAAEDITE